MPTKKRHVVVATEHRGVFAGTLQVEDGNKVTLSESQMCVYWSEDVRGIVGLAATGPTKSCKVTAPAPLVTLFGVTAMWDTTEEAQAAWLAKPWR